ncbi:MAG TPA: YhfZ family protein, partial [Clostridia bacterium]|nr:YhfZ family protein [Clostridia bacterium]
MIGIPYKKDWLVGTRIARGMLGAEPNAKILTIKEYTELFGCSRGIVQNAIDHLEKAGAITLDKRGKNGSFLIAKDEKKLFDNAGLHFITGSMPAPLSIHHAGLATGICQAMTKCSVPFTFAFVQGSKNRADALIREVYDFVVVTQSAAEEYQERYPELELAFPLEGCEYSRPYTLYVNRPDAGGIEDGMTVAADPTSTDQWDLTQLVCAGKNVRIVEMPYISCNFAFLSGKADCVVLQGELTGP